MIQIQQTHFQPPLLYKVPRQAFRPTPVKRATLGTIRFRYFHQIGLFLFHSHFYQFEPSSLILFHQFFVHTQPNFITKGLTLGLVPL
jgi:hypothetical protein